MAVVDVVIPCRVGDVPTDTMQTLMAGSMKDLRFIVQVDHDGRGQSWARNRGAELATAPFLLFSDYDIFWKHRTVEWMKARLDSAMTFEADHVGLPNQTGFVFCRFQWLQNRGPLRKITGQPWGGEDTPVYKIALELATEEWDLATLQSRPYISPMSLWSTRVWREHGLRFDEDLRRLEDWSLYLTAAEQGIRGEWMSEVGFTTIVKPGISWESREEFLEAERAVRDKHGLVR